jgi:hypothetical protein
LELAGFGKFQDTKQKYRPSQADLQAALELCMVASEYYDQVQFLKPRSAVHAATICFVIM